MLANIKKHHILAAAVLFIAVWAIALVFIPTEILVEKVGVHNTYLVAFLLAAIGGLSTITGASFFAAVATFASGGADPVLLGLLGGLGIFISDSIFFFLAHHGTNILIGRESPFRQKMLWFIEKVPDWLLGIFVFAYVGLSPLPNDILMIALALAKVRYKRIVLALIAGSITIVLITATLGENL
ncbi:MAG: hypothetical protein WBL19_02460 [Minisyncoccia bacterium]